MYLFLLMIHLCDSCTFSAAILHSRIDLSISIAWDTVFSELCGWPTTSDPRAENRFLAAGLIFLYVSEVNPESNKN